MKEKIFSITECSEHVSEAWEGFSRGFVDTHFHGVMCIDIDTILLTEAVGHACRDLLRMSDFHLPQEEALPDRHKYAGFVAKWVAKTRPVIIDRVKYKLPEHSHIHPIELSWLMHSLPCIFFVPFWNMISQMP
ncbi:MAG: hypothetical protein H7834_09810 [Magnetococcus sp. YQC-9]